MSTLKESVKYMDAIMEKMNKKVYLVLHEELHNIWVIRDGGGEPPFQLAKRLVNLSYTKVDPTVVRVLYGEVDNTSTDTSTK